MGKVVPYYLQQPPSQNIFPTSLQTVRIAIIAIIIIIIIIIIILIDTYK